jgi:hypothetical protein
MIGNVTDSLFHQESDMSTLTNVITNENPPADSSRDGKGRFTLGNRGGLGNPLGGKSANFRKVVFECVTTEDMREIVKRLIAMEIDGHWQAMKLLLLYTLGKPEQMPPPDAYSYGEPEAPSTNGDFASTPPPSTNVDAASVSAPATVAEVESESPPSPNGDLPIAPPSPNGDLPIAPPSPNGDLPIAPPSPNGDLPIAPPSPNGIFRDAVPSTNGDSPPMNRQQRRALKKAERIARRNGRGQAQPAGVCK